MITKSNWGGAQRYVYDLATNLPKDQYEVEVMAGGNGVLIEKLVEAHIRAKGDLPIGRDINVLGDIRAFFKVISILREKKPDILHINSSKIGGIGALAGRLTGIKKIVFVSHGWAFNENRNIISKIIIKFLHWLTIVLAHETISVSETLKHQMRNWPKVEGKIHVIHNGIKNEAIFSKVNARAELAKISPIFKDAIKNIPEKNLMIVGSVGELHHIKGYEYAIRAFHDLIQNFKVLHPGKEIIYTIISEGEHRVRVEAEIRKMKMENSVILLGRVPSAFHYFKAFDLFLMPSLSEGLPYVLLEAGLARLPVIATAVGGIPEIIDDMKSGILIQPKKPIEIRHAIEFYLTHKKVEKEYGTALFEKVTKEFSIEKMVQETIKVYSR